MTQEEALSILKLGVNIFLTGEPGSGKTHTINRYIEWLRERSVEPSVTASTGIAATHVHGMTIHSWSGIGIKKHISDWDLEAIMGKEKVAHRIVNAKVLIIDEISMLDAATLQSVDKVLRNLRHGVMREEEPFGGLQVIFVGDFFQLPPVARRSLGEGGGFERAQFAFESQAWKDANPVVCYLSEQHRQEDQKFLELLNAVRAGRVSEAHKDLIRTRMKTAAKGAATRLHTHNAEADRINEEELGKLSTKSRVFEMQSKGARALVDALKENCLSPERLTLKEGAKVMFTRNNFEEGYVNGTLGEVVDFAPSGFPVVKIKNGRRIEPQMGEWSVVDGSKILAQIKQVPLRLAWAITVHKSQGMSLDAAIIDLSGAFEFGQGYVALSRVRSLEGLYLEGFNDKALMLHPDIIRADAAFRARSDAARNRILTIDTIDREKLETNFLKAIGAKEPSKKAAVYEVPKTSKLEKIREKFPNANRPWTSGDDERLKEMFGKGVSTKGLSDEFGRKSGAITARLAKLGLIEDDYWSQREARKKAK
jgi:ATP-dependent exoDNAse (exonuclease V) alpha subunit